MNKNVIIILVGVGLFLFLGLGSLSSYFIYNSDAVQEAIQEEISNEVDEEINNREKDDKQANKEKDKTEDKSGKNDSEKKSDKTNDTALEPKYTSEDFDIWGLSSDASAQAEKDLLTKLKSLDDYGDIVVSHVETYEQVFLEESEIITELEYMLEKDLSEINVNDVKNMEQKNKELFDKLVVVYAQLELMSDEYFLLDNNIATEDDYEKVEAFTDVTRNMVYVLQDAAFLMSSVNNMIDSYYFMAGDSFYKDNPDEFRDYLEMEFSFVSDDVDTLLASLDELDNTYNKYGN